ncbi:hypothetical protein ACFYUD_04240 [Nocardia tengchongensis]|uniref:hypothetical protein n=1 Tax=Nocardia tengchongensis TaxID=2055889 RepID=UPI0036B9AEEA
MTNDVTRRAAGAVGRLGFAGAVAGGLLLGQQGVAQAAETTTFQLPLMEVSQSWGVPAYFSLFMTATAGEEPGVTSFGVANPPPFDGNHVLDSSVRIRWVNLNTGVWGVVDIPVRETAEQPCTCAPAAVPVQTGAGRIVALATANGVAANVSSGLGTSMTP